MRRITVATISVAASLALAACAERDTTSPRAITPRVPVADMIPACDPTTLTQDAKKYFPVKDPAFDIIATLKNDYRKFGVGPATTADGFALLARLAAVRDANIQIGTAGDGGQATDDGLGCMSVGVIPSTFSASSAIGGGIFKVTPTGPVTAIGTLAGLPVKWGAEPGSIADGSIPGWPSGTYLVYGFQTATDPFSFELGTIPDHVVSAGSQLTNPLNVGVCAHSAFVDPTGKAGANLLVHSANEVLSLVQLGFCRSSAPTQALSPNASSFLAVIRNHITSFFTPTTLFAQDDSRDFIGGLPSGWSPFHTKPFIAAGITLTIPPGGQAVNTTISSPRIPVTVNVSGTDLPPLNVRLTIAGNNGTPAFITYVDANGKVQTASFVDAPAVISADGNSATATFSIGFTKAGGYTLSATGFIGGGAVRTNTVVSNLFQVQNK